MSHHSSADRHRQPPLAFNRCYHYSTANTPQQQYHHNFPKSQPTTATSNRSVRRDSNTCHSVGKEVSVRIQLFEAVHHHHRLASSFACPFLPLKKPVGGFMATGGTGVFLPVYHTRIMTCTQAHDLINNKGSCGGGQRDKGEHQGRDCDAIPIEKLLPSEWTY